MLDDQTKNIEDFFNSSYKLSANQLSSFVDHVSKASNILQEYSEKGITETQVNIQDPEQWNKLFLDEIFVLQLSIAILLILGMIHNQIWPPKPKEVLKSQNVTLTELNPNSELNTIETPKDEDNLEGKDTKNRSATKKKKKNQPITANISLPQNFDPILNSESEDKSQLNKEMENVISKLKEDIKSKDTLILELQEFEENTKINKIKSKNDEENNQLTIQQLKNEIININTKIDEKQDIINQQIKNNNILKNQLNKTQETISILESQLIKKDEANKSTSSNTSEGYELKIKTLNESNKKLTNKISELETVLNKNKNDFKTYKESKEMQINKLQSEIKEKDLNMVSTIKSSDSLIAKLKSDLKDKDESISKLNKSIESLKSIQTQNIENINSRSIELESQRSMTNSIQYDVETEKKNNEELANKANALQKDYDSSKTLISTLKKDNENLNIEIEQLKSEIDLNNLKFNILQVQAQSFIVDSEKLNLRINILNEQKKNHDSEVNSYETKISTLKKENYQLLEMLQDSKSCIEQLKTEFKELERKVLTENETEQFMKLKTEVLILQDKLQTQMNMNQNLQSQIKNQDNQKLKNKTQEKELQEAKDKINLLNQVIVSCEENIKSKDNKINNYKNANQKYLNTSKVDESDILNNEIESRIQNLSDLNGRLNEENSMLITKLKELQSMSENTTQLMEQVADKESTIEKSRKLIQDLEMTNNNLMDNVEFLRAEIESLKNKSILIKDESEYESNQALNQLKEHLDHEIMKSQNQQSENLSLRETLETAREEHQEKLKQQDNRISEIYNEFETQSSNMANYKRKTEIFTEFFELIGFKISEDADMYDLKQNYKRMINFSELQKKRLLGDNIDCPSLMTITDLLKNLFNNYLTAQTEIERVKRDFETYKASYNEHVNPDLKHMIKQLESENTQLNEELKTIQKEFKSRSESSNTKKLIEAQEDCQHFKSKCEQYQRDQDQLSTDQQAFSGKLSHVLEECERIRKDNDKLLKVNAELKGLLQLKEHELQSIQQESEDRHSLKAISSSPQSTDLAVKRQSEAQKRLIEDNFRKDERISDLQASLEHNKDYIKQIETKLISIDAKFKEANNNMLHEIVSKEHEIDFLRSKLGESRSNQSSAPGIKEKRGSNEKKRSDDNDLLLNIRRSGSQGEFTKGDSFDKKDKDKAVKKINLQKKNPANQIGRETKLDSPTKVSMMKPGHKQEVNKDKQVGRIQLKSPLTHQDKSWVLSREKSNPKVGQGSNDKSPKSGSKFVSSKY